LQDRFSKAVHEAWRAADITFFNPQRNSLFDAYPRTTSLFEPRVRVMSERIFSLRNPFCLADLARVFQRYYFSIFLNAF
jgi:hypothetical protein